MLLPNFKVILGILGYVADAGIVEMRFFFHFLLERAIHLSLPAPQRNGKFRTFLFPPCPECKAEVQAEAKPSHVQNSSRLCPPKRKHSGKEASLPVAAPAPVRSAPFLRTLVDCPAP